MATAPAKAEQWLTIPDVAAILKMSVRTVYRLIADGAIETNAPGRGRRPKLRVAESALARYQAKTALPVPKRGRAA